MFLARFRQLDKRMTLAKIAFVLAALVLVWPIHYRAATGASSDGRTDKVTLSGYETRTCDWELRLGSAPAATPPAPNSDLGFYLLDSYNANACAAQRYSRASQAVLWLIVGACLMGSAYRRRSRPARLPELVPLTN